MHKIMQIEIKNILTYPFEKNRVVEWVIHEFRTLIF